MARRVRFTADIDVGFRGGYVEYRAGMEKLIPEAHWEKVKAKGAGVLVDEEQGQRSAEGQSGSDASERARRRKEGARAQRQGD